METRKKINKVLTAFIFFTSTLFLSGESFRVSKVSTVSISPDTNFEETVKLGVNDSLAITIPENLEYMEGIELKFQIPDSIAFLTDSVSCSLYSNLKPTPKAYQIDYVGEKLYTKSLPNKLSWVLQIPLKKIHSLKSNNYIQTVNPVIDPENNVILIRLQPQKKGSIDNEIISVTVKPILLNQGKLKLSLKSPNEELEQCSVFIDDKMVDYPSTKDIYLSTGVHDVSIVSESYRNELRTIRIEQACETDLSVEMKSIEPTMIITIPDGTYVFLDGRKCNTIGKEFEISEGEHTLEFSIGNYEIVRTFETIKGKTYNATFTLDLQVTEN